MNLRVIKKDIVFFTEEFVSDAFLSLNFTEDSARKDKVLGLINDVLNLEDETRTLISHPEGDRKAFYRGVYENYLKALDALYDQLSEANHPAAE